MGGVGWESSQGLLGTVHVLSKYFQCLLCVYHGTLLGARLWAEAFLHSSPEALWHWVGLSSRSGGTYAFPPPHSPLPSFWALWDLGEIRPGNLSCCLLNAGLGRITTPPLSSPHAWLSEASCPQAGSTDLGPLMLPLAFRVHSSPAGICTTNKTNISREV